MEIAEGEDGNFTIYWFWLILSGPKLIITASNMQLQNDKKITDIMVCLVI